MKIYIIDTNIFDLYFTKENINSRLNDLYEYYCNLYKKKVVEFLFLRIDEESSESFIERLSKSMIYNLIYEEDDDNVNIGLTYYPGDFIYSEVLFFERIRIYLEKRKMVYDKKYNTEMDTITKFLYFLLDDRIKKEKQIEKVEKLSNELQNELKNDIQWIYNTPKHPFEIFLNEQNKKNNEQLTRNQKRRPSGQIMKKI